MKKKLPGPRLPKHKCPFCDKRHDRASDSMIHVTIDHADEVAFKPFNERGYRATAPQSPCPDCGAMLMPTLVSGCICGYEVPSS